MNERPFRFGLINETLNEPTAWLARVQRAEMLGYDTWLIRDHFVPDYFGDQYAPLVALAYAAAATSTLRLGTMVIGNDYRHPVMLAKETATLDALSGGRFELGLGAGWLRNEYEQAGMRYDANGVRVERLEESIAVLKALWSGEPVDYEGKHYRIEGLRGVPARTPHPRLLIGAGHRRMLRMAGREADSIGLLTSSVASGAVTVDPRDMLPAGVDEKLGWIREGAGNRFPTIELSLMPTVLLTTDRPETTRRLIADRNWHALSLEDVWSMPSILVGTPEEIAGDIVQRRKRFGISYYVFSDRQMDDLAPVLRKF